MLKLTEEDILNDFSVVKNSFSEQVNISHKTFLKRNEIKHVFEKTKIDKYNKQITVYFD